MYSDLRRVVTGHNKHGKSCIIFDDPPPESYRFGDGGLFEIWESGGKEISPTDRLDRGKGNVTLGPSHDSAKFRYFSIAPTPEGASTEELEDLFSNVFSDIAASEDRVDTTKHPGMHKTKTIDYIILLKGTAKLILETEETHLKPFDVVVQRGTNHAWVCTGVEPVLFIAVLIDAEIK